MQRVRPVRMSATETAAVWVRWRRGGSISEIGRAMDRSPGSIFYQLATHGGISPVPRTRSWRALTLHDREEISRGLASGRSLRAISAGLGRAPSTISREVPRPGGRAQYRAAAADVCTWYRARRPKPCRLAPSAAPSRPRGRQTGRGLVTAADRGVAETDLSGPSSPPGVARDDLRESVRAKSWRAEKRTVHPSPPPPADAPGEAGHDGRTSARAHH